MGEELLRIGREMAGGKKGATAESGGGGGAAGAGEDGRRHGTESGGVGSSGSGAAAEKAEEEASHAMFPWESAGAAAVKAATDAAASPPRAPTPSRDSAAGGGGAGSNSYMAGQGVASVSGVSPARPGTGVAAGAAAPSYSGLHGVAAGLGRVAGNLSSSAATPSYGGAYGVGVPAVDAVGSSYLGASPGAAMVPGIGSGVSANSRAVLGALRALQEKIKKLEGERAHYREECARLESALSETRATADHDRAAMEANSRVEMTRARAAYGKLLAERNELQQDIVRDKEARKALRREMEILQDQIVSLSSEVRDARNSYGSADVAHMCVIFPWSVPMCRVRNELQRLVRRSSSRRHAKPQPHCRRRGTGSWRSRRRLHPPPMPLPLPRTSHTPCRAAWRRHFRRSGRRTRRPLTSSREQRPCCATFWRSTRTWCRRSAPTLPPRNGRRRS